MPIHFKDAGVWKPSAPWVRDSGVWKQVKQAWVRDAGVWKETMSSGFDPATPIGSFVEGGYYIGTILDGGVTYALIIAPSSAGRPLHVWQTDYLTAPAYSYTNGLANSQATDSAKYPAAQFTRSLNVNGFQDWYLPAANELVVIYNNRSALVSVGQALPVDTLYWSSTEPANYVDSALYVNFDDFILNRMPKNRSYRVIAIRRVIIG